MPLSDWKVYLHKNLFREQQGFYELPYLSNNPGLMLDSIIAMPVSQHKPQEQAIYTDNPFTTGVMRYRNLEAGLALIGSRISLKKNIISKALYHAEIPGDYYYLSFAVFEYRFPVTSNGSKTVTLLSTTCTFYKPNTEVATYFYEDTQGKFFNIIFNKQWANENLSFSGAQKDELDEYLDGESGFINWIDIVPEAPALANELWDRLQEDPGKHENNESLKRSVQQVVSGFFKHAFEDKRIKSHTALHNPDYALVAAAEKIILNNLAFQFPGVEKIAREVNLSPTKLKAVFKSVFGFSMLQYHKEKNLLLAMQLIANTSTHVKTVASLTGYESSSKFTANFKKRFGMLPTDIRIK